MIRSMQCELLDPNFLLRKKYQNMPSLENELNSRLKQFNHSVVSGTDVSSRNKQGHTALHIAAKNGNKDVLLALISIQADVAATDKDERSVLELSSNDDCKKILKSKGADGWTPLMLAIEAGSVEKVLPMIHNISDLKVQLKSGFTPAHLAAQRGHRKLLQALLNLKADINAQDNLGRSPLDVADSLIYLKNHHKHVLTLVNDHRGYSCGLCNRSIEVGLSYACTNCGYDMCVSCFKKENVGCKLSLQINGADGWTLLLIAAELGDKSVSNYLRYRDALMCMKHAHVFPDWFHGTVRHYENLKESSWNWGVSESASSTISGDKMTVQKVDDTPDYSCALGSIEFDKGTHSWTILVDNVRSMWLGIAKGVKENEGLGSFPGTNCETLLAFGSSDGDPVIVGQKVSIERLALGGFSSGQQIEFELNVDESWLKMSVDGKLAVKVVDVNSKGASPYVCMDYEESATILSRTVTVSDVEESCPISDLDRQEGFDNAQWSTDDDSALCTLQPQDGEFCRSRLY